MNCDDLIKMWHGQWLKLKENVTVAYATDILASISNRQTM
jgi:hypothetical protein